MRRLFITRSTLILAFAIWFVEISFSSEPLTPVPKVSVNRVELKRSPHGSYITATCTFENPTSNEVKYTGYARNSFDPPLKPGSISPIYSVEYKSDGQWHECPIGWCGTGMARLGAKPGTTGVFDVILPASAWGWEAIRIGLKCSSSNSKEGTSTMVWSESVSHDGIVHLWRLKRIPDNSPATPGIVKPGNVALASNGATVSGVRADHAALLDGNTRTATGYAWSPWPCEWTVTLDQVYRLHKIRLKLWDGDNRYYRYTIETSADGKEYKPLVDRSKGQWKSWQIISFPPRPVKTIKIRGLYNSINPVFHVVELEAYCLLPEGKGVFSNAGFLDYINRTWDNNIRNQFDVSKVGGGYRVSCDIDGGYEHKLILFHKEDVFTKKFVASFTVERGSCGLSLRPRDLAPRGTVTRFAAGKRYDVQFWIEDGIAKGLVNGEPAEIGHNNPAYYGYFALTPSRSCSVVFHELRFEPRTIAEGKPAAPAPPKKELTIETGDFTIHGTGFQPAVLKNDARAYGNRRYVWKDVPEKFAGCKFTRTNGGVRAKISVKAKRDAVLYVATATIQSGIDMTGWEDTGISFYYTDKGKTRMRVFRKSLKAAEQVVVPQGNWSGGVVVWGEKVDSHRAISATPIPIANPSFETGDFSGWTVFPMGSSVRVVDDDWNNPAAPEVGHSGKCFVDCMNSGSYEGDPNPTGVSQRLDISDFFSTIDKGNASVSFCGWGFGKSSKHNDFAMMKISFFDAASGGNQIGDSLSSNKATTANTWTKMVITGRAVPVGARGIKLTLQGGRTVMRRSDAGFDDVSGTINVICEDAIQPKTCALALHPFQLGKRVRLDEGVSEDAGLRVREVLFKIGNQRNLLARIDVAGIDEKGPSPNRLYLTLLDESGQPVSTFQVPLAGAALSRQASQVLDDIRSHNQIWLSPELEKLPEVSYALKKYPSRRYSTHDGNADCKRGVTLTLGLDTFIRSSDEYRAPLLFEGVLGQREVIVMAISGPEFRLIWGDGITGSGYKYSTGEGKHSFTSSWYAFRTGIGKHGLLVVDKETMRPLVAKYGRAEIRFLDYVEVRPGQHAPLRIAILDGQSRYDFCFQIVDGKVWLFDRSLLANGLPRGRVEGVLIDGEKPSELRRCVKVTLMEQLGPFDWSGISDRKSLHDPEEPLVEEIIQHAFPFKHQSFTAFQESWAVVDQTTKTWHITVDLGKSRVLKHARYWTLSRTGTGDGNSEVAAGSLPSGAKKLEVSTYPCRWNEEFTVNVPADASGKTRIHSVFLKKGEDGNLSANLEIVSRNHWDELNAVPTAVLLDEDHSVVAAATGNLIFMVGKEIHTSSGFVLNLGKPLDARSPKYLLLGLKTIHIGGPMGSHWGRFMNRSPLFSFEQLLAAEDTDTWKCGLVLLDDHIHREVMPRERLNEELRIRRGEIRATALQTHLDRFEQLFQQAKDPDGLAHLCRLAGHSGDKRFVEPMLGLLKHPNETVQDGAAIGLGLLGNPAGADRLPPILQRPMSNDRDGRATNIKTDAALALKEIGTNPEREEYHACVLGQYYMWHKQKLHPFAFVGQPVRNLYTEQTRRTMAGKIDQTEIAWVGKGYIYAPKDGEYLIVSKGFRVEIDGMFTGLSHGDQSAKYPLKKGLHEIRLETGSHGQPYIHSAHFTMLDSKETPVPIVNRKSDIESFLAQTVEGKPITELSGWKMSRKTRVRMDR